MINNLFNFIIYDDRNKRVTKMKKMKYRNLILEILNEIEDKHRVVNVRGGKGGGAGHTYPHKDSDDIVPGYGEVSVEKEQKKYIKKLVKISKAFKKKEV